MPPWKILVVDDQAVNRHTLSVLLEQDGLATVVGRASDGTEAMRLLKEKEPDVITLDLEMPRMDGYTFLRLVKSVRPTPVIVVSSDSRPHSVFQALELGALDFVVRPQQPLDAGLDSPLAKDLREKVLAAAEYGNRIPGTDPTPEREGSGSRSLRLSCVLLAASTGGPPMVQELLDAFLEPPPFAVVIAQHMPPRFTEALAERLRKRVKLPVSEIRQAEPILRGRAYICPGGLVTTLKRVGGHVIARVTPPMGERFAPSADALLASAAEVYGAECAAVVVTGMGRDGAEGALRVDKAGGRVFVEAPMTAVLPTMPQAALEAVPHARVMRKDALCRYFSNAAQALAALPPPDRA